jgi:hypothetical protein
MLVSGFPFLRHATRLGYPYIQSIRSVLPLVDEFVVNVGRGDDDTLERVRQLASTEPKIRVLESVWNERMEQRGFVYAQQKMIAQFNCSGDWAFYIEGDEVVHEDDLPVIRRALEEHLGNRTVEALAFDYLHFYGTPDQLAASPAWYRRETRIIRNTIRSYAPDGQYWVVMDLRRRGRLPRAALTNARIFHYGHVRLRPRMQDRSREVAKYWSESPQGGEHDYGAIDPAALKAFSGTHPAVIRSWLDTEAEHAFRLNPDYRPTRRELKHRWAMRIERLLGVDLSKKNFTPVR